MTPSFFPSSQHSQASVQALEKERSDLFSELVKNLNLTGSKFGELLSIHETALGSNVEGQIHGLEQEMVQLRWKSEELSRLADMEDHICFLKVIDMKRDVTGSLSHFTFTRYFQLKEKFLIVKHLFSSRISSS